MNEQDKKDDISDVSVVVCTRNNKDNIRQVVESLKNENPGELIVVDGNSTDGTREILESLQVRILSDPGKGLALARQIALNEIKCKYTLFVGDDNLIPRGGVSYLKNYMLEHNWAGAAFLTSVKDSEKNYWAHCANVRWRSRFFEGERLVIGTPYMFESELLKKAGYDESCSVSDDSDIEGRLIGLTSKKWGYSNIECLEIGKVGRNETVTRFLMYGKSDAQFWNKYSIDWGGQEKNKVADASAIF